MSGTLIETVDFYRGAAHSKPIRFELVRIIKHALLPWPYVGNQDTYLIEIHITGSPVNRFAIGKIISFEDTGAEV